MLWNTVLLISISKKLLFNRFFFFVKLEGINWYKPSKYYWNRIWNNCVLLISRKNCYYGIFRGFTLYDTSINRTRLPFFNFRLSPLLFFLRKRQLKRSALKPSSYLQIILFQFWGIFPPLECALHGVQERHSFHHCLLKELWTSTMLCC